MMSVTDRPSITVLMAVYNAAATVKSAIISILDQTYTNFEFLVIDDGSTDNTLAVVKSFHDSRIKILEKQHSGLGDSLNFGLQHAGHEIIARMDADDLSMPTRLEKQIQYFLRMPENTILATQYALFSGRSIKGVVTASLQSTEIRKRLALHNEISHSSVMYNKSFILEQGGYASGVFEDFELWLRLKDKAEFFILPEILSLVQYRSESLSRDKLTEKNSKVYTLLAGYGTTTESIKRSFGHKDNAEAGQLLFWREYFFGNQKTARHKFSEAERKTVRMLIAVLLTMLPSRLFNWQKEYRLKFRIVRMLSYFTPDYYSITAYLRKVLNRAR